MPHHNVTRDNITREEASARSAVVRTRSYQVFLDLSEAANPEVEGYPSRSVITFSAEPGSSTFLDFICASVDSVWLNGKSLPVDDVVQGSRILLRELQAENEVAVAGSALYSRSGEGMHRFTDPADGQVYLYTQYEPADARRVFACFEQPDLKAEFTFHVTAPASWEVASNGVEVSRRQVTGGAPASSETAQWDFAPTKRISTYITCILAGPYFKTTDHWSKRLEDGTLLEVPLALYCRSSLRDSFDAEELFGLTKRGLDFFNTLFDYAYPWGKYDQAFVPEYNLGAMENPGLVTFTEKYVFTSRATDAQFQARANTLMHEMAHMWFGDLVTMRWWDDLWLKESFADYMGTLGVDRATEWDTAWVNFANKRKAWAYLQDQLPTTHPIVADIVDLEAAKQNFDGITYAKGASVLKQLVAYVGFDAFIAGTRRYFQDHAFGSTSLKDLLEALSDASGRDLATWAGLWLQTSGISALEVQVPDNDGHLSGVTIRQDAVDPVTGLDQPRPHRLRIGLYDFEGGKEGGSPAHDTGSGSWGALVCTGQVEVDIVGEETPIPQLEGRPRPALLLVNDDDLTYAKVRLDDESENTVRSSLDRLQDPMARALCWTALWDSARDGVTPASLYVDAVRRFAPAEDGIGVLLAILANASTAVEHYVPPAARDTVRRRFLDEAIVQMWKAEPGSDMQLAWARAVADISRHDDTQVELLRGILDGSTVVEGLAVDEDLRWSLWQALAACGAATVAELDAELARDTTASGRAGHATASAAVPVASVKAAAWERCVESAELSNELLGATIAGFMIAPPGLLDPFVEPYFECLERVWAGRTIEIAGRIVRGLFPSGQDLPDGGRPEDHPVLRRADSWLADHSGAPRALRRIVVEQRSHLLRALQAQAAGYSLPLR